MAADRLSVCDQFQHAEGGNWLWCANCGWRWDLHDSVTAAAQSWATERHVNLNAHLRRLPESSRRYLGMDKEAISDG